LFFKFIVCVFEATALSAYAFLQGLKSGCIYAFRILSHRRLPRDANSRAEVFAFAASYIGAVCALNLIFVADLIFGLKKQN